MDSLKELQKAWPMTYLRLDLPSLILTDFQEIKDGVLVLCINLLGASDWCLQSGPALRNKSLQPVSHDLSCSKDARSEVKAKLKEEMEKPRRFEQKIVLKAKTSGKNPNKNYTIYVYIYIYMWPKGVSTSQNFPDSENTKVNWKSEMFLSSS